MFSRDDGHEKFVLAKSTGIYLSVCGIAWMALHCTYRLGLELGVDLVQAGVEASEGADVLLILPGHLLGFTLQVRGRKGTNGRISVGLFLLV